MKIKSIGIKNFRIFEEIQVEVSNYAALVGENGAGKSTILAALNVFFREAQDSSTNVTSLSIDDFHNKDKSKVIGITLTFDQLGDDVRRDFETYVRQDQLVITASAEWDEVTQCADVKQFGERLVIADFAPFFEAEKRGERVPELQEIYKNIRDKYPGLLETPTKKGMTEQLRAYEEGHADLCSLMRSEDQFYGFTKGTNILRRYIHWVYIPAVKDAASEAAETRSSALGELLKITVRSKVDFDAGLEALREQARENYQSLLDEKQEALNEVSKSISERLALFAHPDAKAQLKWTEDIGRSVVVNDPVARIFAEERDFSGDITRFGHGFQRCYILSLLQELAEIDLENSPTLILGMEEPELYQHPPQARHLSDVLQQLSDANAQVFVTTHSPYFVSGAHFENVHLVRRAQQNVTSVVDSLTFGDVAQEIATAQKKTVNPAAAERARMQQALSPQLNEMFFCSKIVFVEGLEDEAVLKSWMLASGFWQQWRSGRGHIIPVGGKSNLLRPTVIAQMLGLPFLTMFDADGDVTSETNRKRHEFDNQSLLNAMGAGKMALFPENPVMEKTFVQWPINFQAQVRSEVSSSDWSAAFDVAQKALGNPSGKFAKNPIFVGQLYSELYSMKVIPPSLSKLMERLEKFLAS